MKFLTRMAAGDLALWCAFWLVGMPLAVIWDVAGTCTVVGCGIQEPWLGAVLLALFTVTTLTIPLASVAIWRSATKYPRRSWWHTLLAVGAKLCATVSAALAIVGLLVLLYIAVIFIYAAFDRG